MHQDRQKIKNNKKVRIFLIFLILSFLFWLLIKLSDQYEANTKVILNYTDIPKNKTLQEFSDNIVQVRVRSIGFNLLRTKLNRKKVSVSLKNLKKQYGNNYYLLTSTILNELNDQFTKSEVLSIKPDTLFFDLSKSITKKLRVIPQVEIQYDPGYHLSGALTIEPEFIEVTGPESLVDTILNLYTEKLVMDNVSRDISLTLKVLKKNELTNVRYDVDKVSVKGNVEKSTERALPVIFEVINAPEDAKITTFPKEVDLVFQISISDFNKVSANDFKVICDYQNAIEKGLTYLVPQIIAQPDIVKSVKINPKKIEFLIEK